MKHNIGEVRKKVAKENRDRVNAYFRENPFNTRREAARDLGLNVSVVGRHAQALKDELQKERN